MHADSLGGTCAQVRRLICSCLARLYALGDSLPLYARVASLQTFLGSKVVAWLG
jgi:hypothetical protein